MIPKIAHFHWTGPTMSWLRMVGIATFVKQNPDWEIRIHGTPPDIRQHGLLYAQEADWTWWRRLYEVGGLQVATDIVFVKPIPEEWLKGDLTACFNGERYVYHNAAFGAVAGHPFVSGCLDLCESSVSDGSRSDYQAFGPSLLRRVGYDGHAFSAMPMKALCPILSHDAMDYWYPGWIELPDGVVGAHWYGGYGASKEAEATPESDYFVCQLAREALSEHHSVLAS